MGGGGREGVFVECVIQFVAYDLDQEFKITFFTIHILHHSYSWIVF